VPAVGKGPIGAAEMELMEMSCRRPGEAWSLPALAAPAVAGERVARPVKPCNAPTTKFSVGRGHRGHTIEPGSFTAEYLERVRAISKATGPDDFVFATSTGTRGGLG
jgi:hypothetical protein